MPELSVSDPSPHRNDDLLKTECIPAIEKELAELMKLRGLSPADVRKIMQYPECDLNQHKLNDFPSL